jgi:rod shape-determining protein MreD
MRGVTAMIVIVAIALLLRSTALTALSARGIVLDILVFATMLWALRNGESWGSTFGFVIGLAADLDAAHWIGRHALVLTLIGYAVGRMSRTLVRGSVRTQAVLAFTATALHQLWVGSFEIGSLSGLGYLLQRAGVAAAATSAAGAVLGLLVRRAGGHSLIGHAATEPDATG